jgi:hypothetical protein
MTRILDVAELRIIEREARMVYRKYHIRYARAGTDGPMCSLMWCCVRRRLVYWYGRMEQPARGHPENELLTPK